MIWVNSSLYPMKTNIIKFCNRSESVNFKMSAYLYKCMPAKQWLFPREINQRNEGKWLQIKRLTNNWNYMAAFSICLYFLFSYKIRVMTFTEYFNFLYIRHIPISTKTSNNKTVYYEMIHLQKIKLHKHTLLHTNTLLQKYT